MTFNQVVRGSSPRWLTKLEDCITMQSFFILFCSKFLMQKSKISTQTAKISRKGRESQCRRLEISTQMGGKTAEKVENPSAAGWKSLPKSGKSAEKGRESQSRRPEISTQIGEISRKGRDSCSHRS